jgi:hypothetical protein
MVSVLASSAVDQVKPITTKLVFDTNHYTSDAVVGDIDMK